MSDDKQIEPRHKYNWDALKLEFFQSPGLNLSQFRRDKKLPNDKASQYMSKKMKGWVKEKQELISTAAKKVTSNLLQSKVDEFELIRARQAQLARMMQLKGAEGLKDLKPEDVGEARKLLLSGLQEERAALGISEKGGGQNLTQVNVNLPKTRYDEMLDGQNYEDILRLAANVKRERARRARGGIVIQGETEIESGGTG